MSTQGEAKKEAEKSEKRVPEDANSDKNTNHWDQSKDMMNQIFSIMGGPNGGNNVNKDLSFKWVKMPLFPAHKNPIRLKLRITLFSKERKAVSRK